MKINWFTVSEKAPQLKDLNAGDTFVFAGQKHLYMKTRAEGGSPHAPTIGVALLEHGDFYYIDVNKYVDRIEGAFVQERK